ncbi:hypothetical protein P3T83_24940 [Pseudocitrobacter sp. 2023EL-00150]|uniref:hypothetical protein n=1 Tax=Pseudocitrobacter sp. 2023EL-00150 TaxID=3032322 RepID=UPI0023E418FE|nr:hypothetical protein [Pseudocitrobacter sp. 2023EL-00150]MDF3830931.1 hypothetical protein [Pseudocitrobacter sp. 2023EL-00150]
MTTPITKEHELRVFITGFLTDPAHDERSANSMTAQVFRIALAAMDAEPVYQWRERYEEGSLWEDCTKEQYDGFAKNPECEARILFITPPAPVVLKWSTKTGHSFRVFPVSVFRFVWG